jgi:hypothetical protein
METTVEKTQRRDRALNFDGYKYVEGMSRPERLAHALDWAAARYPKQWVAYNILLKAIYGYAHTPKLRSQEVEGIRSGMSRVRSILATRYARGLTTEIGLGVRATAGDEDTLKTDMVAQSRRFASAARGYARTAELIDPTKIKPTEDNKKLLHWLKQEVRPRLAQIQSPDYLRKLLPPKESE